VISPKIRSNYLVALLAFIDSKLITFTLLGLKFYLLSTDSTMQVGFTVQSSIAIFLSSLGRWINLPVWEVMGTQASG